MNSYAAYRSKDPFRELLAPEETNTEQPAAATPEQTTPETTRGPGRPPGAAGANRDSDADGVPDRRERRVGTDPNTPDSDDDANGDGRPVPGGTGAGSGTGTRPGGAPGAGQPGRGDDRDNGDNGDGLLNSGGTLPLP